MGTVLIIRHGETQWNKEARYQGQLDIPLSKSGLDQADRLGKRLKSMDLQAIYTSDLERAAQTALHIRSQREIPVYHDSRLREYAFGNWEGLTRAEIKKQYPEVYRERNRNPETTRIPGAELASEVQERAVAAINQLATEEAANTVVLVSHGGTIRTLLCYFLGVPLSQAFRFSVKNTSISRVFYAQTGEWTVQCINDYSHLQETSISQPPR